jgi:hypothetical protein
MQPARQSQSWSQVTTRQYFATIVQIDHQTGFPAKVADKALAVHKERIAAVSD